jgi:hypothetical protein
VAQVAFEIAGLEAGPQPSIPGPAFRPAIVEATEASSLGAGQARGRLGERGARHTGVVDPQCTALVLAVVNSR